MLVIPLEANKRCSKAASRWFLAYILHILRTWRPSTSAPNVYCGMKVIDAVHTMLSSGDALTFLPYSNK